MKKALLKSVCGIASMLSICCFSQKKTLVTTMASPAAKFALRENLIADDTMSLDDIALDYSISYNDGDIPVSLVITEGAPVDFTGEHNHTDTTFSCPYADNTMTTVVAPYLPVVGSSSDFYRISPTVLVSDENVNITDLPYFVTTHFREDNVVCHEIAETFADALSEKETDGNVRHQFNLIENAPDDSDDKVHNQYRYLSYSEHYRSVLLGFREGEFDL